MKVGDEVRVRRPGLSPEAGTVVEVGRTLVTVSTGPAYYQSQKYRMATGEAVKNFGGSIQTLEEAALSDRRRSATDTLRTARVDGGFGRSLEQLEQLAAVVDGWEK